MHYPGTWVMFTDPQRFLRLLVESIRGQAAAIGFYRNLLAKAPSPFQAENVRHALEDEIKHYNYFTRLYTQLTGSVYQPPLATPRDIPNYRAALRQAFTDELEAAESYRTMLLLTFDPRLRDALFEIMTDELEHATRFAFLYADLRQRPGL